jgi:hypothetical protein
MNSDMLRGSMVVLARMALALILVASAFRPAFAQDPDRLAAALAAKDRVDYEGALREVDRALQAGDLSVDQTRAALLLRGEILAVLGRRSEAEDDFAELLAAHPTAAIDAGLTPRVRAAFEAAARRASRPAVVSCHVSREGRLRIRLDPGSSRRARLVRVERTMAGSARRSRDLVTPPSEIVLPRASTAIACFAVDEHGNALTAGPDWDRRLEWAPAVGHTAPPAPRRRPAPLAVTRSVSTDVSGSRPLWREPWIWAVAAGLAGGAGVTLGWLAQRDQARLDDIIARSEMHQFQEAETVVERARSRTHWARGLLVGAGVLGAASVTFALVPVRTRPHRRPSTSVAVGPLQLSLHMEF